MRQAAFAGLLALLATAACGPPPGRPAPNAGPAASPAASFEALYARSCAGCHGAEGRLGPARPLDDPLYLAAVDDDALERIIAEGVPGSLHPALGQGAGGDLDRDQVGLLVSGMRTRWASPHTTAPPAPPWSVAEAAREYGPGDAARGAEVFRSHCAACHGPDGSGSDKAGSVVDPDALDLVTDQALRSAVLFGRPDLGMPPWKTGSDDARGSRQVSDVVAWLAAHRPARPTPDPTPSNKGEGR
jgi:mono/diheme cytochrome c family protein